MQKALIPAMFFEFSRSVFWTHFALWASLLVGLIARRTDVSQARGLDKIVALNPLFFAMPLAIFGAQHMVDAKFMQPMVPDWVPWHLFWLYFVGVALIAAALSILLQIQVSLSGTLLGIMWVLFVLMLHIPRVAGGIRDRFSWAVAARDLSFAFGAFALAAAYAQRQGRNWSGVVMAARFVIGLAAIFYGVEHFLHPANVPGVPLEMVTPPWIPFRALWGYLTGAGLLGAGASMLLGKNVRTAATLLGSWIVLMVFTIYLAILIHSTSATDTTVKIEAIDYFGDTLLYGATILALAGASPRAESQYRS